MTDSVSNETPGQTILILVDHRLTGGFVPSTHDTPDTAQIATFGNVNQALTRPLTCANALTHRHCQARGTFQLIDTTTPATTGESPGLVVSRYLTELFMRGSLLDNPCRYSSGSTSLTFGERRHHGGSS